MKTFKDREKDNVTGHPRSQPLHAHCHCKLLFKNSPEMFYAYFMRQHVTADNTKAKHQRNNNIDTKIKSHNDLKATFIVQCCILFSLMNNILTVS